MQSVLLAKFSFARVFYPLRATRSETLENIRDKWQRKDINIKDL